MSFREQLPPVLRGDTAADLSPASRAHLEAIAHEAQIEKQLPALRDECASRLKQPHPTRAVEYLLAAACALHGEVERAHQTLLSLGDRLADDKQWEVCAAVAERALGLEETGAAAHLLVRAHEGLKKDPERIDALQRAWGMLPDDLDLGLLLAVRLGEAGEPAQRRIMLIELLPRFADASRWAGLEEAALEFVEHEETGGLQRLVQTLPAVALKDALAEARQLLDIAARPLIKAGAMGPCWDALRRLMAIAVEKQGPKAGEPFREATLAAIRQGPGHEIPNVEDVIKQAGLEDRATPLSESIVRFDTLAALAPGRAVFHSSFGAGRVLSNDGENVFLDFAKSKNHRMPYAAALRSLAPIGEDDLRLIRATDPGALQKLLNEDPGTVVVRALKAIGGAGDAAKLKVFLVGSEIVPAKDWTTFWRKARPACEKSPRIDSSRAFEQFYRLAPEGESAGGDDAPLPALEMRKPVRTNLANAKKFLSQHPQAERALSQRFGRYMERAMTDEDGEPQDRARAGIYFARWFPARRDEWIETLKQLWERGLAITDLSTEDEQLALLEAAHTAGVEADAILSALDSRFAAVRQEAARFRAQLDDAGRADLVRTMLSHAPRYPLAAMRFLEDALDDRKPVVPGGVVHPESIRWAMFLAALAIVEDKPKPSVAEKIMKWVEAGGEFDRFFEGQTPPDDMRLKVRVLLRQWRSSDRYLFPAMEAAERLGFADDVEIVRGQRQAKSDKLFAGVGEQAEESEIPVITRATWELLQQELERMQVELKTVIPATIQKARELGDLRENAEYHSAKLKQANVSRLVARLQVKLLRAKFVEEMEYRDGVVGVGTEVTLESGGDVVSYWLLGEGEHHHGEHVISFQTVVGRALTGRRIGDEVELGEAPRRKRWRIVSVERKIPVPESQRATSS